MKITHKNRLDGCREELKTIVNELEKETFTFSILIVSGFRNKAEQTAIYKAGNGVAFPKSKHNTSPSQAFDFGVYKDGDKEVNWDGAAKEYVEITDKLKEIALRLGIPITCGIDWPKVKRLVNGKEKWVSQKDSGHVQLKETK